MENNTHKRRLRKVSTWMSDAQKSIDEAEEILAGKRIVLKVLRYMEQANMTQKELAKKLGVSPQYVNKFLHGQDCDIKVSTAIRYGRILGLKLIDIPDDSAANDKEINIIYKINFVQTYEPRKSRTFSYDRESRQSFKCN